MRRDIDGSQDSLEEGAQMARRSVPHCAKRALWVSAFTLCAALAFLFTSANADVGDPVSRIECGAGYSPRVYAEGLASPDGLAISPGGVLFVSEETAGRVSRVDPHGAVTSAIDGLDAPEGIAFDDIGNLYITESNVQFAPSPLNFRTRVAAISPGGYVTRVLTNTLF